MTQCRDVAINIVILLLVTITNNKINNNAYTGVLNFLQAGHPQSWFITGGAPSSLCHPLYPFPNYAIIDRMIESDRQIDRIR